MSRRRRGRIPQCTSMDLEVSFGQKMAKKFGSDDSPFLVSRSESGDCTLFDGFYLIGSLPWEYTQAPHILYSYPPNDPIAQAYLPFLLPEGCNYKVSTFETIGEMLTDVYDSESAEHGQFFPLYFPENKHTPYLLVYRFTVSPLTLPSFAHDMSLAQLLQHVTHTAVPTCRVCLAMKARAPCMALFRQFVRWILDAESISRMKDFSVIDGYLFNYSMPESGDLGSSWPEQHRQIFTNQVIPRLASVIPCPGNEVVIDIVPFPEFRWTISSSEQTRDVMAKEALLDLVKHVTPRLFMEIFKAVVLENTIIVYHKREEVVSNVILSLHFLLKPMKWVCGSISILPTEFKDLLNAPNPLLIGTVEAIQQVTAGYVYVDLEQGYLKREDDDLTYPKETEMEKAVKEKFRTARSGDSESLLELLHLCNDSVAKLIEPVVNSIITDVSNTDLVQSKFFVELFLKQFVLDERPFMKAFCETQMFQLYIEQECRKRSNSVLADYKTEAPILTVDPEASL